MIHNSKFKKVLLLGSGALQIGQAGEFDYSGSQAIKALKEEGIKVILINPNIATIQTSEGFADKVYFLPVEPHFVQEVIKKEKPGGILLSFGGQTALNCGLNLAKNGILKRNHVEILGTPVSAIEKTEDRKLFANTIAKIGLNIPRSAAATTLSEAQKSARLIGYPVIMRAAFSLGGQDSQICWNGKDLTQAARRALSKAPQVLIEEYLSGWKEIEYEVVRDKFDNCITVCNMENIDPMGIHTGESIVVAPSQTLNNFEYHTLREIAIKVIRHLGIVGECNIQFALNPKPSGWQGRRGSHRAPAGREYNSSHMAKYSNSIEKESSAEDVGWDEPLTGPAHLDYRIIEVNARLSRSSALASKATGYPLAYIATKLALGQSLTELKNSVTKKTIACFEPALDYLVVKIPRWDLAKFKKSDNQIGPSMQSVGEVMAIGRKFEEAIQKAARMLDLGLDGILDENALEVDYKIPTPWRLFAIAQAIKNGKNTKLIAKTTGIDTFFLEKIKNLSEFEKFLSSGGSRGRVPDLSVGSQDSAQSPSGPHGKHEQNLKTSTGGKETTDRTRFSKEVLKSAKQLGFSDKRIAKLINSSEEKIRDLRQKLNIHPHVKQIDTLAAEYPAETNYLYLTYNGEKDDLIENSKLKIENSQNNKIIILGSGPYRIGSSVEFDWCCVTTALVSKLHGFSPIIINCNPETVSTDYDMADKLYFEELNLETIMEIYQKENPLGVIVAMGGQTPNNLVMELAGSKIKILGTSPKSIDQAEDRQKFSKLCDRLQIAQPPWAKLKTAKEAVSFASEIGFPVLVRPSYVLSGAAMNVAYQEKDLEEFLKIASHISKKYPVVISKFIENAKEVEIDAISKNGQILTYAISEHVENAGVHSGDSTMVLPAQKLYLATQKEIEKVAQKIAQTLNITGPFNIQFVAKDNKVMVIECNLRASRSLPFVSKVTGINFVRVATEAILKIGRTKVYESNNLSYVGVKAPQFSFSRIKGADPILRVEMTSTGEVACFGQDIHEAFLKSLLATGFKLPQKSVFVSLGGDQNKLKFLSSAAKLKNYGLQIYATSGTSAFLEKNGIENKMLYKIHENKKPNVLDYLQTKKIDLVINIVDPYFKKYFDDEYLIRRASIDLNVPVLTNLQTSQLLAAALTQKKLTDLKSQPWNEYVNRRN